MQVHNMTGEISFCYKSSAPNLSKLKGRGDLAVNRSSRVQDTTEQNTSREKKHGTARQGMTRQDIRIENRTREDNKLRM